MNWFKKISQDLCDLRQHGKLIYRGSADECFDKLQIIQDQSIHDAIKYGGYTISPTLLDWRDYIGETNFSRL